jgi:hypothetical protein
MDEDEEAAEAPIDTSRKITIWAYCKEMTFVQRRDVRR